MMTESPRSHPLQAYSVQSCCVLDRAAFSTCSWCSQRLVGAGERGGRAPAPGATKDFLGDTAETLLGTFKLFLPVLFFW